MQVIQNILLLIFCVSVLLQPQELVLASEVDQHLNIYSEYNHHQHDNIDDEVSHHHHVHRHSESGEEHEHTHGHGKGFHQVEMKLTSSPMKNFIPPLNLDSSSNYKLKALISSAHLQDIFRPPVS